MAHERLSGRLTVIDAQTVRSFGLSWVREVKAREVRPTTAADYEARLRREVFPILGDIRMIDLSPIRVDRWISSLVKQGRSASTINGARAVLNAMCNYAELIEKIPRNPVRSTRTVKRRPSDRTQVCEPWSREEVWRVLDASQAEMNTNSIDAFVHLMLHTGLRPGEALGLRWEDVDLDSRQLRVTGTLKESRLLMPDGSGVVRLIRNEPKTASSYRSLPISDALYAALERQKMLQSIQKLTAESKWQESGYVLTSSVGTPISGSNFRKQFAAFLDRNGIRRIRPHDLRHTVAKLALDEGKVPIEQTSQALGHTRIDTTKQIYAGYVPRYNDEFSKGLSEVLPPLTKRVDHASETSIEFEVDQ